jgi:hypothetical protein
MLGYVFVAWLFVFSEHMARSVAGGESDYGRVAGALMAPSLSPLRGSGVAFGSGYGGHMGGAYSEPHGVRHGGPSGYDGSKVPSPSEWGVGFGATLGLGDLNEISAPVAPPSPRGSRPLDTPAGPVGGGYQGITVGNRSLTIGVGINRNVLQSPWNVGVGFRVIIR